MNVTRSWWTAERRAWLYKVAVALIPILIGIGAMTGEMAQMVLNLVAAFLGVSASGMALVNVTPDNVFKIAVELDRKETDGTN
jgi:hypothetical protein